MLGSLCPCPLHDGIFSVGPPMKDLSKATIDLAAARHLADGFNFRAFTPHKIAHELIRWDQEFKDADYTALVTALTLWQSNLHN